MALDPCGDRLLEVLPRRPLVMLAWQQQTRRQLEADPEDRLSVANLLRAAQAFVQYGDRVHRAEALEAVELLLHLGRAAEAADLWQRLEQHGWLPARTSVVFDPGWQLPAEGRGFAWRVRENPGIERPSRGPGLQLWLQGSQPDQLTVAEQFLIGSWGENSTLRYRCVADAEVSAGWSWTLAVPGHGSFRSPPLICEGQPHEWPLPAAQVPSAKSLWGRNGSGPVLALEWRRSLGTRKGKGSFQMQEVDVSSPARWLAPAGSGASQPASVE
jgi:hypothetical protein